MDADNLKRVRALRNAVLAESDWTQLLDAPITDEERAKWAKYRQSLRDLPDDEGEKAAEADVVWPDVPAVVDEVKV